jgi:hypothetical protein
MSRTSQYIRETIDYAAASFARAALLAKRPAAQTVGITLVGWSPLTRLGEPSEKDMWQIQSRVVSISPDTGPHLFHVVNRLPCALEVANIIVSGDRLFCHQVLQNNEVLAQGAMPITGSTLHALVGGGKLTLNPGNALSFELEWRPIG